MDCSGIPRARFRLDGVTVEVEPCPGEAGEWRGRIVAPEPRAGWHRGHRAWGAVEAAARAERPVVVPDDWG